MTQRAASQPHWDDVVASRCKKNVVYRRSYIPLQLDCADIGEVEREENLPGADVQHVVLFAEEEGGVIEDPADREMFGYSLLRIWTEHTKRGVIHECQGDLVFVVTFASHRGLFIENAERRPTKHIPLENVYDVNMDVIWMFVIRRQRIVSLLFVFHSRDICTARQMFCDFNLDII